MTIHNKLVSTVVTTTTYVIMFSVIGNIFMPVNAVANAVDNTNSITLQNSAAVPTVKASDYAAAQAAKEKSEASVKADYEAQKAAFAKANKISVAVLNDEISGKTKNPKYLDLFLTSVNSKKLKTVNDRDKELKIKQSKGLTKAETAELTEIEKGINFTQIQPSSVSGKMSTSSFGPSYISPRTTWDTFINTLGTTQVSTYMCKYWGYKLPAPYEPGDILVTSEGQSFGIANVSLGNTGHDAIIISQNNVVEAPGNGLTRITSIDGWCGRRVRTMVGYVRGADKTRAVNAATSWMLGRPYPDYFKIAQLQFDFWGRDLWDISTMYCSKLVWRIYADQGIYLDSAKTTSMIMPIDLFLSNKTIFNYSWASK